MASDEDPCYSDQLAPGRTNEREREIILIMRTSTALQSCCLGLGLIVVLLGQGMAAPSAEPSPINCMWSRWSEWTACDPCAGKAPSRSRSRGVEVFGQFGGTPCRQAVGEKAPCATAAVCQRPPPAPCAQSEFQCGSGECIRSNLKCNGDSDCQDSTDEDECEDVTRKPCGLLDLENNEQGRTAGYGINILGTGPQMNAFYNDYFNGRCEKILNPSTQAYDRLPWNVGQFHYATRVEEHISTEVYEDTHTIMSELLTENSFDLNLGINLKYTPTEKSQAAEGGKGGKVGGDAGGDAGGAAGGAGVGAIAGTFTGNIGANIGANMSTLVKQLSEYTTQKNKAFVRVTGKVQLSTYRLRSLHLQLANDFVEHVRLYLPLEYEKGRYFGFIEDWGTHYTKDGKSGGEFDLVYVMNKEVIKAKKVTETTLKVCLKGGISANMQSGGVEMFGTHVKPAACETVSLKRSTDGSVHSALVEDVLLSVAGGSLAAAEAMAHTLKKEGVLDALTFSQWAESIAMEPALLDSDPEPIYTLIPMDMANASVKISNLKRGIEEYVAEYSLCKCKPCQNGGTLALIDGQCMCLCPPLYEGQACQRRQTDTSATVQVATGTVAQVGNWACWSSWTGCSGHTHRSRTRSCNTEGLTGATCRGEETSDDYC